MRHLGRSAHILLVLASAAALAAGCDRAGGEPPEPTSPTPRSGASSAGTTDPDEAAILAAYQGWWDNIVKVARRPDPDSPLLDDFATGERLTNDRRRMANYRREGLRLDGTVRPHPRLVKRTADRAVIHDCNDNSGWHAVTAAGSTVPNPESTPALHVATLVRESGRWKVAKTDVEANRC